MSDLPEVPAVDGFDRRAVARAPDAILGVSADGSIYAYHRGTGANGISVDQPVGLALTAALPAPAAAVLQAAIAEALATGEARSTVYALHPDAGQESADPAGGAGHPVRPLPRYVEARIVPDGPTAAVCYLRDITEQRRTEQSLVRRDLAHGALAQSYHRLLMAEPGDDPVTLDMLAMLGYAASAGVAYFVDLMQTELGSASGAVGLLWEAGGVLGEDPARAPMTLADYLARRPLKQWLPAFRSGRPVQSAAVVAPDGSSGKAGMWLAVPILTRDAVAQDALVGLLIFEQAQRQDPWPAEEVDLLRAAATAIAFHIERAGYVAQVEASAEEIAQMNVDLARARDLAQASDRAKSEFLAVIGHELRTPLNPIISMTEMLLDSELSEEQQDYAEMVHEAGQVLLTQINGILDYVKVDTEKADLRRLPLDPAAQVTLIGEVMMARAQAKQLTLMTFCHPATPRDLVGDAEWVHRVLEKLVDNAIKFTETGDIIVRVEPAQPVAPEATRVTLRFSVMDTGIGLAPDADSWLFRPFTQADASATRSYEGTGLGLATAQRWVAAMGGEIGARPNPAGGTVFWFTVPLDVAGEAQHPPAVTGVEHDRSLDGLRVLVVGELDSERRDLSGSLPAWHAECNATADLHEALGMLERAHARRRPYHVAFLDCRSSEIQGIVLATAIRQRNLSPGTRLVLIAPSYRVGKDAVEREAMINAYMVAPPYGAPVRPVRLYDAVVHVMAPMEAPAGLLLTDDEADEGEKTATTARGPVVLLIEANAILRRLAARDLARVGFEVIPLASEEAALRELSLGRPVSVALVDLRRYGARLAALAAALRREAHRGRGASPLPIVGMAAVAGDWAGPLCAEAGLDACMALPLTPAAVEKLYARWGGG